MTKYADIYDECMAHHGLISSSRAVELGISNNEIVQYARRGRLERVGHGLYRLVDYDPQDGDEYALAVARAGSDAHLVGESVLGLLKLSPAKSEYVYAVVPGRIRKKLPENLVVVKDDGGDVTSYDGVPSQPAIEAIKACMDEMSARELIEVVNSAVRDGYITAEERDSLFAQDDAGK